MHIAGLVSAPRYDANAKLFQRVIAKSVTAIKDRAAVVPVNRAYLAAFPILQPGLIVLSIFPIAAGFTDGIQSTKL
jgi:hypothetical protein